MAIELYDEEIRKVMEVGQKLNSKYAELPADQLFELMNEAQFEFHQIGFKVNMTTDERTGNFTFEIVGRVDPHEFDHEKKQWEVQKSRKEGDEVPNL